MAKDMEIPEKPEKPKRAKKAKKEKKGRGLSKKLLLIPLVLLLLGGAVTAFFLLRGRSETKLGLTDLPDQSVQAEPLAGDSSAGDASSGEESPDAAPSAGTPAVLTAPKTTKTMTDSVDYIKSLSPGALGLEGDSMEEYEVIPQGGVVLVDGHQCTEVDVYAKDDKAGTNRFLGSFLLDRSSGQLYRLDQDSDTVTPVDLTEAVNGG